MFFVAYDSWHFRHFTFLLKLDKSNTIKAQNNLSKFQCDSNIVTVRLNTARNFLYEYSQPLFLLLSILWNIPNFQLAEICIWLTTKGSKLRASGIETGPSTKWATTTTSQSVWPDLKAFGDKFSCTSSQSIGWLMAFLIVKMSLAIFWATFGKYWLLLIRDLVTLVRNFQKFYLVWTMKVAMLSTLTLIDLLTPDGTKTSELWVAFTRGQKFGP